MISKFYYDPLDAWSPFGNDVDSDTYYLYYDWKREHPNENIKVFLDEELISSGYPRFDLYMDGNAPEILKDIVNTMANKYIDGIASRISKTFMFSTVISPNNYFVAWRDGSWSGVASQYRLVNPGKWNYFVNGQNIRGIYDQYFYRK